MHDGADLRRAPRPPERRRRGVPARSSSSIRRSQRALTALDALFTRQKMWSRPRREPRGAARARHDRRRAARAHAPPRRPARDGDGQVDVAIEGYRAVLERDSTNAQALAALERLGQGPDATSSTSPTCSSRCIGTSATTRSSSASTRCRCAAADDATRRGRAASPDRAALRGRRGRSRTPPSPRCARALAEDPANEATQQQLDRVARATGRFADLAQRLRRARRRSIEDPALASALYMMSARVYENDLGDVDIAIGHYRRCSRSTRRTSPRPSRSSASSARTERYQELSHDPPAQGRDPRRACREEGRALPGGRHRGGRPRAAPKRRSPSTTRSSSSTPTTSAPSTRSSSATSASRAGSDLLAVYAKKADLVADPDEKKRIYYQVGAVYERELGDVARAIDTYHEDPRARSGRPAGARRASTSSTSRRKNWTELLRVLTRESEMTGDPDEAISFQYRIAELYEKHLDDVPRADRALPRDPPAAARSRADARAPSRASRPATRIRSAPPPCSSRSTRPRATGRSSSACTRCRSARATIRSRRWSCSTASRASTRTRSATTPSAFDTYARALPLDNGNEETLGNLERLAMVVNRWPQVAALYDARARQACGGEPRIASSSWACASRRSSRSSSRTSTSAIARYRRVADVDSGEPDRDPRARPALRQTERWAELAADPRARGGDRPVAGRDPRVQVPARAGPADRLDDLDAAIAAYRDVLSAAPEHAGHARGARGPLRAAAPSRSRSARSSSRSTAR